MSVEITWMERVLAVTVVGLAVTAMAQAHRADEAEARSVEGAERLHAAALAIEQLEYGCDDVAFEYIERGNILFVCQEDVCEVNGWTCGPDCSWDREDEGPDVNYPTKKDNQYWYEDHYPNPRPPQEFPK